MSNSDQIHNSPPKPREAILNMESYSAPLENRRDLLRLDFNENTIGPSPRVFEALQSIKPSEISIYPEYELLKKNFCEQYFKSKQIISEEVSLFNGADGAINAIFNSYGENNKVFLTTTPTFGYYQPCADMRGMRTVTSSYLGKNFLFPLDDFEKKIIKYNPKLIFICNPNNPTGTILSSKEILELATINKNSLIVVDELYEKFYGDSLLPEINFENTKNIVVIQSLSKTAGLAGLRIGFAFGNKKVIEYINKVTGPYDINSFAVKATLAALKDQSYFEDYILQVKKARNWIKDKFDAINIRSHFGGGNYFLIWPNKSPTILVSEMRSKGILIRSMKNKKDIEGSIRISIGTKKQMIFFWETYKDLDLK